MQAVASLSLTTSPQWWTAFSLTPNTPVIVMNSRLCTITQNTSKLELIVLRRKGNIILILCCSFFVVEHDELATVATKSYCDDLTLVVDVIDVSSMDDNTYVERALGFYSALNRLPAITYPLSVSFLFFSLFFSFFFNTCCCICSLSWTVSRNIENKFMTVPIVMVFNKYDILEKNSESKKLDLRSGFENFQVPETTLSLPFSQFLLLTYL